MQHLNNKVTLIATAILGLSITHAALAQSASPERLNETLNKHNIYLTDVKQSFLNLVILCE